ATVVENRPAIGQLKHDREAVPDGQQIALYRVGTSAWPTQQPAGKCRGQHGTPERNAPASPSWADGFGHAGGARNSGQHQQEIKGRDGAPGGTGHESMAPGLKSAPTDNPLRQPKSTSAAQIGSTARGLKIMPSP